MYSNPLAFGESPEQCAAREVFEEGALGGLVPSMKRVGVVNAVDAAAGYHYVCWVLLCETSDEVQNNFFTLQCFHTFVNNPPQMPCHSYPLCSHTPPANQH